MAAYWFLFLVPAFAAFLERPVGRWRRREALSWFLAWLLFTVFIGLRYRVGGDWNAYERMFRFAAQLPFAEVLVQPDLGYVLLNWLAAKAGAGIVLVNVTCAAVFTWGLVAFAREQPRAWLAFAVAVPYLVTVVAMGYSRQAVAIGFAMLAFAALGVGSTIRFAVWITAAALFHRSAILLIPIAVLANTHGRLWTAVWIGATSVILYYLLLADSVDAWIQTYAEAYFQSEGAAIRVLMNALPATVFLIFRRHFNLKGWQLNLWTYLSFGAVGFAVLIYITPSFSTAIDRVALYLIPIQLFVLSRLPAAAQASFKAGEIVKVGVIIYSAVVLFVWLNFAEHARFWLPYKMWFFIG